MRLYNLIGSILSFPICFAVPPFLSFKTKVPLSVESIKNVNTLGLVPSVSYSRKAFISSVIASRWKKI